MQAEFNPKHNNYHAFGLNSTVKFWLNSTCTSTPQRRHTSIQACSVMFSRCHRQLDSCCFYGMFCYEAVDVCMYGRLCMLAFTTLPSPESLKVSFHCAISILQAVSAKSRRTLPCWSLILLQARFEALLGEQRR